MGRFLKLGLVWEDLRAGWVADSDVALGLDGQGPSGLAKVLQVVNIVFQGLILNLELLHVLLLSVQVSTELLAIQLNIRLKEVDGRRVFVDIDRCLHLKIFWGGCFSEWTLTLSDPRKL